MKKIDANPQGFLSELGKLLAEEKEKKAKDNLDEKTKLEQKFGIETVAPTTLGEFFSQIAQVKDEIVESQKEEKNKFLKKYKIESIVPEELFGRLLQAKEDLEQELKVEIEKVEAQPIVETVVEEPVQIIAEIPEEQVKPKTIVDQVVAKITQQQENTNLFTEPQPEKTSPSIKAIQDKLKSLEQWMGKISMAGPGSGSYWLNDLGDTDHNGIKNAVDGQVLGFSEATGKWTAIDQSGGGGGGPTIDSYARAKANAAYDYANTIVSDTQVDPYARTTANAGFIKANSANVLAQVAYDQANVGTIVAQSAYDYANTIVSDTQIDPYARTTANAGFIKANSANVLAQDAYDYANTLTSFPGWNNVDDPLISSDTHAFITMRGVGNEFVLRNEGAPLKIQAATGALDDGDTWTFNSTGSLIFPDSTTQTTAFTGYATDNTARTIAQAAYDQANTLPTGVSNPGAATIVSNTDAISRTWTFDTDSSLDFPNGVSLKPNLYNGGSLEVTGIEGAWVGLVNHNNAYGLTVSDSQVAVVTNAGNIWRFTTGGGLMYPDGTTQNTAFTSNTYFNTSNDLFPTTTNTTKKRYFFSRNGTGAWSCLRAYDGSNIASGNATHIDLRFDTTTSAGAELDSMLNIVGSDAGSPDSVLHVEFYVSNFSNHNQKYYIPARTFTLTDLNSLWGYNGVTGDIGTAFFEIADDFGVPYVQYVIEGVGITTSYNANNNTIAIQTEGQFAQSRGFVFSTSNTGSLTFPDGTIQTTAYTGTTALQAAFDKANSANILAQSSYDFANTVNAYSYSAYSKANTATTTGQAAFDKANTAITTSGGSITGRLNVAYTPATTVGEVLTLSGANTHGGTGYVDVLKLTNTSGGATNPNKYIRLDSAGTIQIVNDAYTATVVSISDSGVFNATGLQVNGKTATNGPIFSAYQASSQSIPTDVLTKVTFDTEDYDTHGNFSSSRFTPTVEGFYQLSGAVRVDGGIGTGERMIVVYKNGSEYMRAYNSKGSAAVGDSWFQMEINVQVYANGTGDYFEIYMQHGAGGNRNLTAARAFTRFQGCMIRGA